MSEENILNDIQVTKGYLQVLSELECKFCPWCGEELLMRERTDFPFYNQQTGERLTEPVCVQEACLTLRRHAEEERMKSYMRLMQQKLNAANEGQEVQ